MNFVSCSVRDKHRRCSGVFDIPKIEYGGIFYSGVSSNYKWNAIDCLLDRAYKINSDYRNMYNEFDKLLKVFGQNSFGINLIEIRISKNVILISNHNLLYYLHLNTLYIAKYFFM